jgi:hypothetical protein
VWGARRITDPICCDGRHGGRPQNDQRSAQGAKRQPKSRGAEETWRIPRAISCFT